ncbi:MAG TPA: hypothetical protein IAB62_05360 [Candidatus Coprocola pullicola]|nr:hypothetical protein [Candidatus Coprocola pullicola]
MAYPPPGSIQTECTRLPVMLRTIAFLQSQHRKKPEVSYKLLVKSQRIYF